MKIIKKAVAILSNENYKNNIELQELKNEMEQVIREKISLKTNSRSKISAIKRISKNASDTRPVLKKYNVLDNGNIVFTDSYQLYMLNAGTEMPIEKVGENETYPDTSRIIRDLRYTDTDLKELDLESMILAYQTKQEYFNIEGRVNLNPIFIYDAYRILGTELKYKIMEHGNGVYLVNKDNEFGLVLGSISNGKEGK